MAGSKRNVLNLNFPLTVSEMLCLHSNRINSENSWHLSTFTVIFSSSSHQGERYTMFGIMNVYSSFGNCLNLI